MPPAGGLQARSESSPEGFKKLLPAPLRGLRSRTLWLIRNWWDTRGRWLAFTWRRRLLRARPVRVLDDPPVLLYPDGNIAFHAWTFGVVERREVRLIVEAMADGGVFFDVGSNAGLFALAVGRCYPAARVHAFEPIPSTVSLVERNLALNHVENVRIVPVALAASDGSAQMRLNAPGLDGLNTLGAPTHPQAAVVGEIEVPTMTLDTYCATEEIDGIDVMKVDVEGAERDVFLGGRRMLSGPRAPLILFENYAKCTHGFGHEPADVVRLLGSYGYTVLALEEASGRLRPYDIEGNESSMALAYRPHHLGLLETLPAWPTALETNAPFVP